MNLFLSTTLSALIATVIGALIFYVFRIKQLYLRMPILYEYSELTSNGKLVEFQILNNGRAMEEGVHINMPLNLDYELIASDHPDVILEKNKITISRIPPMTQVSMLLLAEGNTNNDFAVTLNSKTSNGTVYDSTSNAPSNYGNRLIGYIVVALIFIIPTFGSQYYFNEKIEQAVSEVKKDDLLAKYSYLEKDGWEGYDIFVEDNKSKSYPNYEFPITFSGIKKVGKNTFELTFIATNKTTYVFGAFAHYYPNSNLLPDTFTDDFTFNPKTPGSIHRSALVDPLSSKKIVLPFEIDKNQKLSEAYIDFNLRYGDEIFHGLIFRPKNNNKINLIVNQELDIVD